MNKKVRRWWTGRELELDTGIKIRVTSLESTGVDQKRFYVVVKGVSLDTPFRDFTVYFDGEVKNDDGQVLGFWLAKHYVFISYVSHHTGRNLGCCIVQVTDPEQANERAKELGLMPNECNQARGFALDEDGFKKQGMELNRLYSREEMVKLGFSPGKG